ncbi:hypothetical protein VDIAB_271252 [Vibrio diabolicus]|nr:hypothetical protein VDIAB_271252 [Vibrio diabolicus]
MESNMDRKQFFNSKIQNMETLLKLLLSQRIHRPIDILCHTKCQLNHGGVYTFSVYEKGVEKFLYVGQSGNIGQRLQEHCAIKNHNAANFAYKVTVERSGLEPIAYSPHSTKKSMFSIPDFKDCFDEVVNDIKQMNYRWIPIANALEKNLFEIYASVVLDSKYNNFD